MDISALLSDPGGRAALEVDLHGLCGARVHFYSVEIPMFTYDTPIPDTPIYAHAFTCNNAVGKFFNNTLWERQKTFTGGNPCIECLSGVAEELADAAEGNTTFKPFAEVFKEVVY